MVLPKSPARPPILNAFREALTATLPIAAGFLFIGAAYGFYMQRMGFSFWYPMLMAMIIFGGSLEFVTVTMLLSPFAPLQAFLMALMIQARHLFYGIAMLDRYKGMGWKKPFLIYGMCDETFALIFAKKPHPDVDPGFVMTSMFIVIFVEQVRQQKTPLTASIGLCSAVICRLLFGPDHFLIPTMIVILILVTGLRKRITQKGGFPS